MARFARLRVLNSLEQSGLIPIFYNNNLEAAKKITSAAAEGGISCIEMTNRGDMATSIFKELEIFCIENYPELILGAGSIIDAPTAAIYIAYGANFIVSPVFDKETAYNLSNMSKTHLWKRH